MTEWQINGNTIGVCFNTTKPIFDIILICIKSYVNNYVYRSALVTTHLQYLELLHRTSAPCKR